MGILQSKNDTSLHNKGFNLEDLSSNWTACIYTTQNHALNFLTELYDQSSSNKVQKYKIKINESFDEFGMINLQRQQLKFANQSVVLFLAANNETRFHIYWKSKDSQQLLSIKTPEEHFTEDDSDLCEFVADFLADSLKDGHLGIKQNLDISARNGQIELHSLVDSRNYNLLLLASESGNEKPIQALIKYGIEPRLNLLTGEVTAQDLAWKGRHFNVLMKLLQAKLPLPVQFDISECSEELKRFIESGENVNDLPQFSEINECSQQQQLEQQQQQEFSITIKILNEKGEELVVQGCKQKEDVLAFLSSDLLLKNLCDKVLVIKIQYEEEDDVQMSVDEQNKLCKLLAEKNAVVTLRTRNSFKSTIYWTSTNIGHMLALKSFSEASSTEFLKCYEFIADFLVSSLATGHSGIISTVVKSPELSQIDINLLADSRDFNLLLIAAEQGNVEMVRMLLQLGMISDLLHIDAQTLAWNNRHHYVLLELLKANLTYPKSFDIKKCSKELKDFYKISDDLHTAIKSNSQDEVKAILNQNLGLKYYYNSSNDSALKTAINAKSPEIYDILLEHKVRFAPHEDAEELYGGLEYEMKRELREIHNKFTQVSEEKHVNILLANSCISHDDENAQKNVEHIQRAFRTLNMNNFIRIILMIVAASKKFKIIFDFNRDSVNIVDPTVESNTQGLFYLSGRIYIGAKQLLDKATEHETFGVIAHELCHFAMNIVYRNDARPYTANDNQSMQEFEQISKKSQESFGQEKIVNLVYECYPQEAHHAELIVRVVHMLAFYYNQPEKLLELQKYFSGLFNFYETKVVPEMKAALPDIEKKVEIEIKKKDKKISKLRFLLFISIGLGITVACLASWYFYEPIYKFNELSENDQVKVQNALVRYKNVTVKFVELFPENSDIFVHLTSDHISQMLDYKALNFDDSQFRYLEEKINLKWENLAGNLKEKFLDSNVDFQGEIVKFIEMFEGYPNAFNALTLHEIIDVLSGKELKIGEKFEDKNKFYVERNIIPEDVKLIRFEFDYGHEYVLNYETEEKYVKNRTKNKSFQKFSNEFIKKDFDEISKIFEKIKQNSYFKKLYINLNGEDFHFMHKSSIEIIDQAKKEKILVLSSEAGAGKTVTFEKLTMKIKSKFPTRWVSYIDLPRHTEFNTPNITVQDLLKKIFNLNQEQNKFEVRIFEECFKSGNLVLLWNAFDEISPTYNDFILNVLKSIHVTSSNIQFVCTRPLYSDQLSQAFKVRTWQLLPFDDEKKEEFLREFFISENVSSDKIQENIEKVEKIVEKLNFDGKTFYNFETPLMLKLIAEIHENEKLFESANIYGIFEAFVKKKIKIWLKKSEETFSGASDLLFSGSLKTVLQKFALLNELYLFSSTTLGLKLRKLQIMQRDLPKDFPIEEISRMGILFINGKNNFQFSHRTLSEFFVAQFFIENVFDVDGSVDSVEGELRLELFFHLTKVYGEIQQIITDFMTSYLQMRPQNPKKFNPTISKLLRTKFKNFFIRILDTNYSKVFEFLFEFFKPDHDLLVDLLHVHEPETFYTAIFNPNHFALFTDPNDIKSLAQICLTDAEFQKFLTGKNQKGKILFGIHFYELLDVIKSHDSYRTEIEVLSSTSFWDFFPKTKELLTIGEKKELFVAALSPKIYLFYDILIDNVDFSEYEKLWTNFENLLTQTEMKDVIGDALLLYYESDFLLFYFGKESKGKNGHENFLNLFLKKVVKFLSSSQIFEMFLTKNILNEARWDTPSFKTLWNFFSSHTSEAKRRQILLQNDLDDKNFFYFGLYKEMKERYSSYHYPYFYYDFTPFKIFHKALTIRKAHTFDFTKEIYQKHLSKSEIQEIILSSNDFLYYVIRKADEEPFEEFVEFLTGIFEGNEKLLKEFLERKIEPTNLSVFEFVEDFRGLPYSDPDWFNNLKILSDFYNQTVSKISYTLVP